MPMIVTSHTNWFVEPVGIWFVAMRMITAASGRNSRLISLTMPYSAMPDVATRFGMPQPRSTTHRTPMFHGPSGMLLPMPDRISQDWVPRLTDNPGINAQNTRPLAIQATIPRIVMRRISCGSRAWKAASTSE